MNNNPLLAPFNTPYNAIPFNKIEVANFKPAFDSAFESTRKEIKKIIDNRRFLDY